MLTLLWVLLAGYGIGILLPLCLRRRKAQGLAAGIAAITATIAGIALGLWGLTASEPLAASIPSTIPLLTFAIRLDALAAGPSPAPAASADNRDDAALGTDPPV